MLLNMLFLVIWLENSCSLCLICNTFLLASLCTHFLAYQTLLQFPPQKKTVHTNTHKISSKLFKNHFNFDYSNMRFQFILGSPAFIFFAVYFFIKILSNFFDLELKWIEKRWVQPKMHFIPTIFKILFSKINITTI